MPDHPKSFFLTSELHEYLVAHAPPIDDVQRDLITETAELGGISMMQISPEQGAFMTNLTKIVGAKHAIEVGTFTGYSSICIARGLGAGGHLLCCDVSEEWTSVAQRYWTRAGLDDRIVLKLGPALDTLRAIPPEHQIDLAFIDADKPNYRAYYEELLPHVRPSGVILVDNTLWSGTVVDPEVDDDNVRAIRDFNDFVAADDRVEGSILTVGDGLTLLRKQ